MCAIAQPSSPSDPDTVRGADVAFYSYSRMPRGPLPPGYLPVPPELVFEVRLPRIAGAMYSPRWSRYLDAGVSVVCYSIRAPRRCIHIALIDPSR